jgi:hypothetical protein
LNVSHKCQEHLLRLAYSLRVMAFIKQTTLN